MKTLDEAAAWIKSGMLEKLSRVRKEEHKKETDGKKVLQHKVIWDQFPVSPEEFILSPDFLDDKRKRNIWPAVREDMIQIFSGKDRRGRVDYSPACNLFLDCEGLGSGKSTKIALLITYTVYWLHCLKNPFKYFGLSDLGTTISIMNVAPTEEKAKRIVYQKLYAMLHQIPWFHDMGYMPDKRFRNELRFYKQPNVTRISKEELDQLVPFVVLRAGAGKPASIVGEDVYTGVVDEAASDGGFELLDGTDRCEQIFEVLNTRRKSRFVDRGINYFISSAGTEDRWLEQMIMKTEEHCKIHGLDPKGVIEIDDLKIMYRRRASYDANPKFRHEDTFQYVVEKTTEKGTKINYPLEIPMSFRRNMETQPEKTLRDICALPTMAYSPFFTDMPRIRSYCNKNRVDPLPDGGKDTVLYPLCKKCTGAQPQADVMSCAYERLPGDFRGTQGTWYYCHVDLGTGGTRKSGRDACGFAIAHRGPNVERNGTLLPTVVVDLAIRFKADKKKVEVRRNVDGKVQTMKKIEEVDLAAVREFILRLDREKGFRFAKITYDGFQSLETVQTLQKLGYLAERAPCNKDTWDNLRTMWYDDRIDIFEDGWLLYELSKLEDKGAKVDHAVGASNDEAEAVARAVEMCIEGEMPEIRKPRAMPRMAHGIAGRSFMGGGGGGAAGGRAMPRAGRRGGRGRPFYR